MADSQDTTDERVIVTLEDAITRLPDGDRVHTFRQAGCMMIGADWLLNDLLAAMREHGVIESGPAATGMKHGLVLIDERGPLFIETRSPS